MPLLPRMECGPFRVAREAHYDSSTGMESLRVLTIMVTRLHMPSHSLPKNSSMNCQSIWRTWRSMSTTQRSVFAGRSSVYTTTATWNTKNSIRTRTKRDCRWETITTAQMMMTARTLTLLTNTGEVGLCYVICCRLPRL